MTPLRRVKRCDDTDPCFVVVVVVVVVVVASVDDKEGFLQMQICFRIKKKKTSSSFSVTDLCISKCCKCLHTLAKSGDNPIKSFSSIKWMFKAFLLVKNQAEFI